jgi:hypothetical protein
VTSKIRLSDDAPSPERAAAVDAVAERNTARAHHAHRAASRAAISSRAPRGATVTEARARSRVF